MEARPWKDGKTTTYRYHPIGGRPINLGQDREAAIRRVLDMSGRAPHHGTLRWVWEDFTREGAPSPRWARLAPGSQADYRTAWRQLDAVLGHLPIAAIDAPMIARYAHVERRESPRRADIEKALLSRLFGHAIKLGVAADNPTRAVEPHGSTPRQHAPSAELLARFLGWLAQQTPQRRIVGLAAEFAAVVGSRKAEFLHLERADVDRAAGVVRLRRAKQRAAKRQAVIEEVAITPRLAELLDRIDAAGDPEHPLLFPTRDGNPYTPRGFATLWQRVVADAIAEKVIAAGERFTFHDLRAHHVSEHKRQRGALPDLHADPGVTARVYDRTRVARRSAL